MEIDNMVEDILSNIVIRDASKVYVFRVFYKGDILEMPSGKYQWNNISAAKNAIHNMIDVYSRGAVHEWWKHKEEIYEKFMEKVEIRKC